MKCFIAQIKGSDGRSFYVGLYNRQILRRSKVNHASIFTNALQAYDAANTISLHTETIHILPFVVESEVTFGDL